MARRRRGHGLTNHLPDVRDFNFIANRRLDVGPRTRVALATLEGLRRQALAEIEDRRRFHPQRHPRPTRDLNTRKARVVALSLLGSQMSFQDPLLNPGSRAFKLFSQVSKPEHSPQYSRQLGLCIRRKMRAEVLHAAGIAGSSRIKRSRRRNEFSDVKC